VGIGLGVGVVVGGTEQTSTPSLVVAATRPS